MKTREEIIHSMCVMYREDYEVPKLATDPPWVRGMTALEAAQAATTIGVTRV